MNNIDYKKEWKHLYNPPKKEVALVEVPPIKFLMTDGSGYPGTSQEYQDAIEALYGLSYTLKFMSKKSENGKDYTVMPLEGLWWMEDMSKDFMENREDWLWTSMIMQPGFISKAMVDEAASQLRHKKNPVALDKIRFEEYQEGLAAQIMHLGPYAEEGPVIKKMHDYIDQNGYKRRGKHHEIYLSDPRRTAPEKMKTILRQPVIPLN